MTIGEPGHGALDRRGRERGDYADHSSEGVTWGVGRRSRLGLQAHSGGGIVDCASCGFENVAGARFCGECGASLATAVACPGCGVENPSAHKFCNACGYALNAPPSVADAGAEVAVDGPFLAAEAPGERDPRARTPEHLAEKIRAGQGALEGERKQVTVLFADVMGSMELAERSDPEQWRQIMERFFAILCEGVHRFEGTVDKFTGDGIMALFGAPIAHEDHAQRACYAALHLQQELASYAAELRREQGLSFSVRMGLNSGEVVVGAIGEDLAHGLHRDRPHGRPGAAHGAARRARQGLPDRAHCVARGGLSRRSPTWASSRSRAPAGHCASTS